MPDVGIPGVVNVEPDNLKDKQDFEALVTAKLAREAQMKALAEKKNKTLIEISELVELLVKHLGIS